MHLTLHLFLSAESCSVHESELLLKLQQCIPFAPFVLAKIAGIDAFDEVKFLPVHQCCMVAGRCWMHGILWARAAATWSSTSRRTRAISTCCCLSTSVTW